MANRRDNSSDIDQSFEALPLAHGFLVRYLPVLLSTTFHGGVLRRRQHSIQEHCSVIVFHHFLCLGRRDFGFPFARRHRLQCDHCLQNGSVGGICTKTCSCMGHRRQFIDPCHLQVFCLRGWQPGRAVRTLGDHHSGPQGAFAFGDLLLHLPLHFISHRRLPPALPG